MCHIFLSLTIFDQVLKLACTWYILNNEKKSQTKYYASIALRECVKQGYKYQNQYRD